LRRTFAGAASSLNSAVTFGASPQAFQAVEAAAVLGENVEDEVAVVEQDPAAGRGPFHEERFDAVILAELVDDAVGNGLRLPLRGGRAQKEVVGDRGEL